jgi:hypothetical protein
VREGNHTGNNSGGNESQRYTLAHIPAFQKFTDLVHADSPQLDKNRERG